MGHRGVNCSQNEHPLQQLVEGTKRRSWVLFGQTKRVSTTIVQKMFRSFECQDRFSISSRATVGLSHLQQIGASSFGDHFGRTKMFWLARNHRCLTAQQDIEEKANNCLMCFKVGESSKRVLAHNKVNRDIPKL